ncbi:MAG: TonB-dependent receptor plug domain-containing protein, partial [Rikenellaceae bacterium]|nr:TonB-dependent receptor plug domain-containing protein [Rikenellaceae bacterium]
MKLKRHIVVFISMFFAVSGYAQQADSSMQNTYNIDEIVVTGTRNETDIRHLPMTITVLGRSAIEQTLQSSLLPVLTERVPGLFTTSRGIMGYGVSGGAAGDISIRGLNGGSGRLMVLIDGHPQYMGLMGHPISDSYQSFMAERVEVLRGPAYRLYGSNAMGGVVEIVARKMRE